MAKTIKQYAEEYGRNRCKVGCDDFNECFACKESLKCREYYCKVETYAEIATEQRKRDIEKACEWFESQISRGKGASCRVFFIDSVESLRKAMEDKQ